MGCSRDRQADQLAEIWAEYQLEGPKLRETDRKVKRPRVRQLGQEADRGK